MTELIKLPDNTTEFTARWEAEDGSIQSETFYVEDSISLDRFQWFERFRLELGFGVSFMDLVKMIQSNIDLMERMAQGEKVFTQMATLNYNALNQINDVATKEPFAYWLCALFINTKHEDRRWFKEEVMREKIRIWKAAGYDSGFFLKTGLALVVGFSKIYTEITEMSFERDQMLSDEHPDPLNPNP